MQMRRKVAESDQFSLERISGSPTLKCHYAVILETYTSGRISRNTSVSLLLSNMNMTVRIIFFPCFTYKMIKLDDNFILQDCMIILNYKTE